MINLQHLLFILTTLLTLPVAIHAHTTDRIVTSSEIVHLLTHPHHVIVFIFVIGVVAVSAPYARQMARIFVERIFSALRD